MSRWKIKRRRSVGRKQRENLEREALGGPTMITGGAGPGFSYTIEPISPEDSPHMVRYIEAHEMLPFLYNFDPRKRKYRRALEKSLRVLADTEATTLDLTRAIVILGHSPDPQAVTALEELSDTTHPLAVVARMALQECLTMMTEEGPVMSPVAGVN